MAKTALRGYGVATSGLRPLPDFLIIGGKRCGTTSLYNYLLQHPQVAPLYPRPQKIKGVHFFDTNYHRGVAWYRSHFPSRVARATLERRHGSPIVAGEASTYYLFHPLAAGRAAGAVPHAKLIVLLRDPVERAYSHYRERVRHGAETLSFQEAIEQEPVRLAGEEERIVEHDGGYYSFAHEHLSYAAQGRYARHLERWMSLFDREQLLTVLSEDLYRDPQATYQEVVRFLGLPGHELRRFRPFNYHPGGSIPEAVRDRLAEEFRADNARLAALLGTDLSLWGR